jgi:segregation and condensation protein B
MSAMRFARTPFGTATRRPYTVRPGNVRPPLAVRLVPSVADATTDPSGRTPDLARVEAALFLADEPLTARKLTDAAGVADPATARRLVEQLRSLYDADGSAFQVEEVAGGYQLLTRPVYQPWLLRLRRTGHDLRLTPAAMETLAVVAYRQPVTRADIEAVRGVGCAEMIRILMERGLVRNAGRHNSLGRPQMYGTTKKFLQVFGLNTLGELPDVFADTNI